MAGEDSSMLPDEETASQDSGNEDPIATSSPPRSTPEPVSALRIGIAGSFWLLLGLFGLNALLLAINRHEGVLYPSLVILLSCGGLLASFAAWQVGGYGFLGELPPTKFLAGVYIRFIKWLNAFGRGLTGFSVLVAVIIVGSQVVGTSPPTPPIVSQFAFFGALAGSVLSIWTGNYLRKRRDKLTELRESLTSGAATVDAAFARLAEARSDLENVRKNIERKAKALQVMVQKNAEFQRLLEGADEGVVKALEAHYRKASRQQNLLAIAMTGVGWLLGTVTSAFHWDRWLTSMWNWVASLGQ